jgi:nucleotide-binding universal stress UspA family protein
LRSPACDRPTWNVCKNRALPGNVCIAAGGFDRYSALVKTILAPVDFSAATAGVVAQAAELARALNGRIILLSVLQPPVIGSEYAPLLENMAEIRAAGENAAAKNLARWHESLQEQGIASESIQLNGAPIQQIVDQAAKQRADFIVMGSHGHTALYDLLVGSTTHGVLMRATCPVVILPPNAEKS